jgi:hypothetical protein
MRIGKMRFWFSLKPLQRGGLEFRFEQPSSRSSDQT